MVVAKVSMGGGDLNLDAAPLIDGKSASTAAQLLPMVLTPARDKLDRAEVKKCFPGQYVCIGRTRARQSFVLYGSKAASDPGWNVADLAVFTPIIGVDSRPPNMTEYEATSIRRSTGKTKGSFRWLVLAASPTNGEIGG